MVAKKNEVIKRSTGYLVVNLQRKHEITHQVSVKVHIPYKYDRWGIIQEEPIKVDVDDENYFGTVTVFPKLYLSKATRALNDEKKEKIEKVAMRNAKKFTPRSAAEYDLYTHTNVSRPYRG